MKYMILRWICCLLAALLVLSVGPMIYAEGQGSELADSLDAPSLILMEAESGKVLLEKNADEKLPPASVTKVMTMLLVMEAIDSGRITLTEMVTVSEHAASMGGSQVYLKVGEQMSVEDMLKSVVVSSANDASVALAEHIMGSEEAFVARMNERAKELGMENTLFRNTNGLDDTVNDHMTSARDIALMSRALIVHHPKILEYSSIWMDTIRDGTFGLSNTNRLIRFYPGANGLKTGSTSKAKFCISATAKRDGMQLIAVVMASPTKDARNETAKRMLDYGFSQYAVYRSPACPLSGVRVLGGVVEEVGTLTSDFSMVLNKGSEGKVERVDVLQGSYPAPISAGDKLGVSEYYLDGEKIGESDILASESVEKIGFFGVFVKLIKKFLLV